MQGENKDGTIVQYTCKRPLVHILAPRVAVRSGMPRKERVAKQRRLLEAEPPALPPPVPFVPQSPFSAILHSHAHAPAIILPHDLSKPGWPRPFPPAVDTNPAPPSPPSSPLPELDEPPAPAWSCTHEWVGVRVRRFFEHDEGEADGWRAFDGVVTAWLAGAAGDDGEALPALWHVVHDTDHDEEDLELSEVELAMGRFEVAAATPISLYEVERLRSIRENKAKLQALGIGEARLPLTVRPAPRRRLVAAPPTTLPPKRRGMSERQELLEAMKASLAEVRPEDSQALFRPTELADAAMERARPVRAACPVDPATHRGQWHGVAAVLHGQPRCGPFERNRAECSAETAQMLVGREADGQLLDVDVSALGAGEAITLGVTNAADDVPGSAENDYVYILNGLRRTTLRTRQMASFETRAGIVQMGCDYKAIKSKIDNAWHEQGWAKWTNDPQGKLRRSTEVRQLQAMHALASACGPCVHCLTSPNGSLAGPSCRATRPSRLP